MPYMQKKSRMRCSADLQSPLKFWHFTRPRGACRAVISGAALFVAGQMLASSVHHARNY
jgi:hypothetical protein